MQTPDTSEPFDKELCDLVLAIVPRLFAVVQECEVRPGLKDGCVAAWGWSSTRGPST
ncbi:hypothetical protein [Streptomyces sp. 5-10]|uniref:hypothetical protein n=1 Tax=Streptomyces sp. 5-10 TaxID=878925 RepID=UPI001CC3265F|nr:hypothetical protein [Streptomyces sp. 5-10]